FPGYGCMPTMRYKELVIEASKKRMLFIRRCMLKYTKQFFAQRLLLYSVKMIKCCLRSPAYIQGRCHMCPGPIKYSSYFLPIGYLFKGQHFYRSPRNNHSIVKIVCNF